MEFHFNQTEAHLYDFAKQYWRNVFNSKVLWVVGILILLLIVLNILAIGMDENTSISFKSLIDWFLPILIIVSIWLFFIPILLKRQLRNPHTARIALGERYIYLNEDKIIVKTPNTESFFEWNIITKLKSSKMSYFLYIGKYQAVIIPKSVFANQAECDHFEHLVANKINT